MPNPPKSLLHQRFSRLLVLAKEGKNAHGNTTWMCQCDCGAVTTVLYQHLVTGRTQSCGQCAPSGWAAYHQKKPRP